MRRWLFCAALCVVACSDPPAEAPDAGFDGGQVDANNPDVGSNDIGTTDAGPADVGSTDAGVADTGVVDTGVADAGLLAVCLERPDELPRPPTDRLPCELIPPNF